MRAVVLAVALGVAAGLAACPAAAGPETAGPEIAGPEIAGPETAEPRTTVPATAGDLHLVLADWEARALGREARGALAWVTGPGAELRLDVLAPADGNAAAVDPEALWGRQGSGWTLVAGAAGEPGVLEPWGHPWRPAPPGLVELARAVADGPPGQRRQLVLAAPDSVAVAGQASPATGLRASLVRRGRGGGGPGERVTVTHRQDGDVRIASTRRPGELAIRNLAGRTVAGNPVEVYTPWWSLREVLPGSLPDAPNSGTRGPDGR